MEEAIYDSYAMRRFMGINFIEQDVRLHVLFASANLYVLARAGGSL